MTMNQAVDDQHVDLEMLATESRNPATVHIDAVSTIELCRMINNEDLKVAKAVSLHIDTIARVIDQITSRLARGGRVIQLGAGTSGRLGVLDASEIPPTYSAPVESYIGLIAGGDQALRKSVEDAEDSRQQGQEALATLDPPLSKQDTVIGIAASGRTPYVLGALEHANSTGCLTVGIACVENSAFRQEGNCEEVVECIVGPEVVTGSTRMKAGTATKLLLNMISTGVMIRTGKTYGNLMVDLKTANHKLVVRARRVFRAIVATASEEYEIKRDALADDEAVDAILRNSDGSVKVAALAYLRDCSAETARALLQASEGRLKQALASPTVR
ncbi:glucokinase regulatory-like protein [Kockovaella imperatae]|uniref:Glucokinase regulatory-like protein n=1 Tax=Kockovaella imperatae TaxID=4999 RepID=A0A1Y1UPD8_9TREE|nr:glucokinase regulatory-like protein [Kockovaella imperatae]ORX39908.1 glucokinase regulatory-like protein [Kockovaella imperatae]